MPVKWGERTNAVGRTRVAKRSSCLIHPSRRPRRNRLFVIVSTEDGDALSIGDCRRFVAPKLTFILEGAGEDTKATAVRGTAR